jgi:hypothetical protein
VLKDAGTLALSYLNAGTMPKCFEREENGLGSAMHMQITAI